VSEGPHLVIVVGGGAQTTYDQRGDAHNHPKKRGRLRRDNSKQQERQRVELACCEATRLYKERIPAHGTWFHEYYSTQQSTWRPGQRVKRQSIYDIYAIEGNQSRD
jgi:hypothetical protein